VKVGEREATGEVKAESTSVTLEMRLEAGESRLQTWLEGKEATRGAFYVEIERVK
jgi:hypothetical protein